MPAFPEGHHHGTAVPLDRANVDTDAIFPKQYGRGTARSGYGPVLFDSWRYLDPGDLTTDHSTRRLNPDFVLNQPALQGASVLLARDNFGCGSSREHAVWALRDYGIKAVVSPSFGDIFRQNCAVNGIAALALSPQAIATLFDLAQVQTLHIEMDLHAAVLRSGPHAWPLHLTPRELHLLTHDTDWIAATLAQRDRIAQFESARLAQKPWLAPTLDP